MFNITMASHVPSREYVRVLINSKDILYGKAQWFMADEKMRRKKSISPVTSDYDWVTESLEAEANWK